MKNININSIISQPINLIIPNIYIGVIVIYIKTVIERY
jgi:hypothetical protein